MTDVFEFKECLKKGLDGEKKVKELFANFYYPIANRFLKCEGYKYGLTKKGTEKQRSGIDGKMGSIFRYDPKIRSYYKDKIIFLEILHNYLNYPKNQLGWFLTSEADVVFYLYRAKSGSLAYFDSGYYLFLNNLRKWLIPNKKITDRFLIKKNNKPSENNGILWDTYNMRLEPKNIPQNCILKIEKNSFFTPIEESYFYNFFKGEI